MTGVPTLAAEPLTSPTVRLSPSTSVSLPSTPGAATMRSLSSLVVPVSSTATGASLTPVIVIVTVAVFESTVAVVGAVGEGVGVGLAGVEVLERPFGS